MKKAIYLVMALLIGSAACWASTITFSFTKTAGGFTDTLSAITVTPPPGKLITDLSASLANITSPPSPAKGKVTLALTLSNGTTVGSIFATPGHTGSTGKITFSGVTSLTINGTLTGNSAAQGMTTLTLTPSFSSSTHAPEPGSVTLVGVVLLAFIGLAGYSRRKVLA